MKSRHISHTAAAERPVTRWDPCQANTEVFLSSIVQQGEQPYPPPNVRMLQSGTTSGISQHLSTRHQIRHAQKSDSWPLFCATMGIYQPVTSFRPLPISAKLRTVFTPASSSAANFSSAVPLPPEIIAPACPMRLPGGAVTPAI